MNKYKQKLLGCLSFGFFFFHRKCKETDGSAWFIQFTLRMLSQDELIFFSERRQIVSQYFSPKMPHFYIVLNEKLSRWKNWIYLQRIYVFRAIETVFIGKYGVRCLFTLSFTQFELLMVMIFGTQENLIQLENWHRWHIFVFWPHSFELLNS